MKRNLFAIFLAMALVVALVFVVAPSAKAEAVAFVDGMTISENTTIDLAGKSGTINVAEGVKLSVIDSKNTGISGEGAGKLIVNGEVEVEAVDEAGRRFLAVPNDDGSYSFHPFYLTIKQVGINTNKAALCLQAMFVTNEVAQEAITTGILYGENAESLTSGAGTYGAFSFENGVMYAYYDLIGSLADESAMNAERAFQAYIKVGDKTVTSKTVATVSPVKVLETLDTNAATPEAFTAEQRTKMKAMIDRNDQLKELCYNFTHLTLGDGWVKVTDVSDLAVGDEIVIVATDYDYALGTTQNTNNRNSIAVTKDGNKLINVSNNVQVLTLTEGTVAGTFGFNTGSGYLYAASGSSNHLKTQTTNNDNGSWKITIADDGVATIKAQGTNSRNWLRFNNGNSPKIFSCYASGQTDVAIYKFYDLTEEHTEGTQASCDQKATCKYCGEEYGDYAHSYDAETGYCECGAANPEHYFSMTIPEALGKEDGAKITVTGTVVEIAIAYDSSFKNISVYISDDEGNRLYLYRLSGNVSLGDVITVTGEMTTYSNAKQVAAGATFEKVGEHNCTEFTEATCTASAKCTFCSKANGAPADHTDVEPKNHVCDVCDAPVNADLHIDSGDGSCDYCGGEVDTGTTATKEVEFTLGANGSASHADGNSKTTYSETVDGYTLSITNGNKFYTGARDAKGNSCFKLGTGSAAGSFKFTVAGDVTEVKIYVAKYKANAATVKVNGTTTTLTKASNNGEYDVITIDTTITKTIEFAVSSGYRCMINTIAFTVPSN